MPELIGDFPQNDTVFFIAADENYFHRHAIPLISSIRSNFNYPIHFHLYNPSDFTKVFCKNNRISISYEYFDISVINTAYKNYLTPLLTEEMTRRRLKMLKPNGTPNILFNELVKTYFACARFIRLYQLLSKPTYIIMLDTDSLVRKPFILPNNDFDIHIFEKSDKSHVPYTQHLASTIFYTGTDGSYDLIREHAMLILNEFNKNTYYWFLDQETLDSCLIKYKKCALSQDYVDFDMNMDSYIWCAKGKRKNLPQWIHESLKFHKML